MGMFSNIVRKEVNVEELLKFIEEKYTSSKKSDVAQVARAVKRIIRFIEAYLEKRDKDLHPIRKKLLRDILAAFQSFDGQSRDASLLQDIKELYKQYCQYGVVYLLRHPAKSKEKQYNIDSLERSLHPEGVKQARAFGMLLVKEVLLAPGPVRIVIRHSFPGKKSSKTVQKDVRRTQTFALILRYLTRAKRLGKDVTVSITYDPRIRQTPLIGSAITKYKRVCAQYGKSKGSFRYFKAILDNDKWLHHEVKQRHVFNPVLVQRNVQSFVDEGIRFVNGNDEYTIFIGISHSWILDVWLHHFTEIGEIIGSAEFAKVEYGKLYYKGWHDLF